MAVTRAQLKIGDNEHRTRCERLIAHIHAEGLDGVVLFDSAYILYYTGFAFIPTERPMAFVLNKRGSTMLFVPRLELEHAGANALVDDVDFYLEYPDDPHPMQLLAKTLEKMAMTGRRLGVDSDGYPWILGYRGPQLSEVANAAVVPIRAFVEDEMAVKSAAELALLRESCRWANLAHTLLQRYTAVGATETAVSQRASSEATQAMLDAIGPVYRGQNAFNEGATAGYRGQIGRNAAIPHALANNITFQHGDVLVTGATAPVWGYVSELERTMIIGQPTDEQRRLFDHMVALQDTAFAAMSPGKPCAEVDRAVRDYFNTHDLMPYWKHHVGHCIGLRYHEGPFLDRGDTTEMRPGMVFTVEPGLYVPGLGGFRHSDTVVINADGIEILTYYPRDLESLTLPG